MSTIGDLATTALGKIGVLGAGQTPTAADMALVVAQINRILNRWNAQRDAVYADVFASYTLTVDLNPHTLGPTGATWSVTQRPVTVDGVSLQIGSGASLVQLPIRQRDATWWEAQAVPNITSGIPTDFYYDASWPNGSLYLWPVPSVAYDVQIRTRVVLASVTKNTTFSMPPAYEDALLLTTAEEICPDFTVPVPAQVAKSAREARVTAFANNAQPVRIATAPFRGGGRGSSYNWRTGLDNG